MTATYDATKISTEAHHWIRWRLGAVQVGGAGQAARDLTGGDEGITAALVEYGLVPTSNPITNKNKTRRAAILVCQRIITTLGYDSEVPIQDVQNPKAQAAQVLMRCLRELKDEVRRLARPRFFNPASYAPGHVADVDPLPDPE